MARFPGRPGQINASGRTRVSFRRAIDDSDDDGAPSSLSEVAEFEISRWCESFRGLFSSSDNNDEDEEDFEGFAANEQVESKTTLERKMQELGGNEQCADVLDEVNRAPPTPSPPQKTPSNTAKVTSESGMPYARMKRTRMLTMRARPGMRDVVRRSYAEMNKHGFDTDDDGMTSSSTSSVVNDADAKNKEAVHEILKVELSPSADNVLSLRPCPIVETPEPADVCLSTIADDTDKNVCVQSAVNSEELQVQDGPIVEPLSCDSSYASIDVVELSVTISQPPPLLPPPVQRKTFMLPERSARSSRIIFPKKRNMEDFEFSDVLTAADEKRSKLDKTSGQRMTTRFPQVALAESDCIDEPAFWNKISEKHGWDCGERMRKKISRYTETMARNAVNRKGVSPQRAASSLSTSAKAALSPKTSTSATANDNSNSGNGSPVSAADVAATEKRETGGPNADKVAAKIQKILRSQWEGRLDVPKRKRGRPRTVRATLSPTAGERAEAEHRRVSARLRTKTILRKARLKLNKRTLMKLRPPANLRRLSEQFRAEQDKVSVPFRLLKFPTVQLQAIDTSSATVRLPPQTCSATSSSLDNPARSCISNSFTLSPWTTRNGGKTGDNSIFSKLTLPAAITVKSLPLINPYITISKLDTSKIVNNTIKVKEDVICLEDDSVECPPVAEAGQVEIKAETVLETRVSPIPVVCEPSKATEDMLERSLESNVRSLSETNRRSRGRHKGHQLWSRARRPSGPRVKHVCRRASVVLGLPVATFPSHDYSSSSSPSPSPPRESKAGLFFPGILDKLKKKNALKNGKTPKVPSDTKGRSRYVRCKTCVGCLTPDCRKCAFCLDRSKYGGLNKLKQACKFRVCLARPVPTKKQVRRTPKQNADRNAKIRKPLANSTADIPDAGSPDVFRHSKSKVTGSIVAVRRLLKKAKTVNHKKERFAPSVKESGKTPGTKKAADASGGDCNTGMQGNREPSLVNVAFWEDYDIDRIWNDGMPAICSTNPVLRASCYACGSAGIEELIYCILCCEPFHPFCLDHTDTPYDGNFDNWCCQRCQYCQVCGQRDSLLKCFECHNTYHAACLGDNYPSRPSKKRKIWMCTRCVKCKSCGATSPGKSAAAHWMCDFSLCYDCGKLFDKGNFCPMCKRCYEDDDDQCKMILCSICDSWVHAKCAKMTDEEYQVLTFLPDSYVVYTCGVCSPNISQKWMSAVKTELYAGFKKILDTLYNSKQASFLRTKDVFSERRTMRICVSPLAQSVISDLQNSFTTKCNEGSIDRPKCSNLLTQKNGLDKTKKLAASDSKHLSKTVPIDETKSSELKFQNLKPLSALHVDIPVYVDNEKSAMKLSSETGNRVNAALVDGAPWNLNRLSQKMDDGKYSSVMEFCEDIVRVVRFCSNMARKSTKPVRDLLKMSLAKTFPWFKWSETELWGDKLDLMPDAFSPPSADHSYAQYICRSLLENATQPSIFRPSLLTLAETQNVSLSADGHSLELEAKNCLDTRRCVLCGLHGDSDPEVSGRLLYCGQDDWIHINCALWSAEVFEEIDGSLQRVHSAILRGSRMKCDNCGRSGATVGCCCKGCTANYHFACAQRNGAIFQEDKTVYCSMHTEMAIGKHVSGSGFQVRHIMYVDLEDLHPKWSKKTWQFGLHPSSVTVLVGSMTVESLGEVTAVSDHVEAIIPINFCCTRLYWSTTNPRQRVVYTCRTVLDMSDPEPIREPPVDENHTIEHIAVVESEITNKLDSTPCLQNSSLDEHPLEINHNASDEDDIEQLTLLICGDELQDDFQMEMLSNFCNDCMIESAINVDNYQIDGFPTDLVVDGPPKEGTASSMDDRILPAVTFEETTASTTSESGTVAKSFKDCVDDASRLEDFVKDDSPIRNSESGIEEVTGNSHEEDSTKDSPNMESFAEALQELVCNVLHSGQLKLSDTGKTLSGKGKGKGIVAVSQKKTKATDSTSSRTGNENQNFVSHWNGSLFRVQHFKSDKRNCSNNNNNNCHRKIFLKNSSKASYDVRLPEVLLRCRKCSEAVKSASGNVDLSNKLVTQPFDLLHINGTKVSTSMSKKNKKVCLRALPATIPAVICDESSSEGAGLLSSELVSSWFGVRGSESGDDSDLEEKPSENGDNRGFVSLALSRACCSILSGGDPLDARKSVVPNVFNEKKIDPMGTTDQGVGVSQSAHVRPTALTEKVSSGTSSGGSQSNVPFLETPPPGGGTTNHQSDGSDARKSGDSASGKDATPGHSVRGNPHRCPKCKRIYRTAESFQRHYQTCDFEVDSSSSSEDEETISPGTTSALDETRQAKSDAVCIQEVSANEVETTVSELTPSSSNDNRELEVQKESVLSKSRVPATGSSAPPVKATNTGKTNCARHPKRILPKTLASVCQQQQRMAAPANLGRTIPRVVRVVGPQTPAPIATQAFPSFMPQHQPHHVIQVQGRTFMIPICHVPSQSHLHQQQQQQQQQQQHSISYAEQLAYLGSLHLSSQGQLTSVSLNIPVSQLTLPTVGGLQPAAAFYQHHHQQQQQHQQHQLVQPAVHLTAATAACNQQQLSPCLIAPHLQQHQVALHSFSLAQQNILHQQQEQLQQQQNENWGQMMHVDIPNPPQFNTLQSVQETSVSQQQPPLTCSTASQTQLSPTLPRQEVELPQFPPTEIAATPTALNCGESLIANDVEVPLERREYREAETSTDFDVICDPPLSPVNDHDVCEEVSTSPLDEKACCSVNEAQNDRTTISVESTTQTTPEEEQGDDDDDSVVDDCVDETSEFADLLKKVSQQIASLASSRGRMACAILPARPCSSSTRQSSNTNLPMSTKVSDLNNKVGDDDVQVEPYAATVEVVEQRLSATDLRTTDPCDAPPTPFIIDSRSSRTGFISKESSENPGGPRIAFEISSEDGFHIRSASVDEAWRTVAERVQEVRAASQMRHLSTEGVSGLKMFGVTNRAVRYILEQLPGTEHCRKFQFIYHHKEAVDEAYENQTGCARSEVFTTRKEHDMFNFLASRHRMPPEYNPPIDEEEFQFKSSRRATSLELPMAMRFRHIGKTAHEAVGAYRSKIHGRGLFCKRNIDAGEMVIEYAGEVIRSILTDKREKYYDAKGIGCYMFKIDDNEVVDATMHGNAARFINHSCEPNCYSKVISVDGKKHIVIFALRRIMSGEELTYDYKFPIEDDKIPCTCGSRKCRRYLN